MCDVNIDVQLHLYHVLIMSCSDMNDKVIPSPIKAMLATFLLKKVRSFPTASHFCSSCNSPTVVSLKWRSIPEQTTALRMALSLSPPDEIFWRPVSIGIAQLPPKEKVDD